MVPATPLSVVMADAIEPRHATAADAAAKLADDVKAAAEALENVKRLLQRQLTDPARARLQSGPNPESAPRLAPLPSQRSPMVSTFAVPQGLVVPLVPAYPVLAAGRQPRRLYIGGFILGLALSAAIGAALYFCLAAG